MTIIFFLPKNELISFLDNKVLSKEKITVKVALKNNLLNYKAHNSKVIYDKNLIATLGMVKISPFILYNNIELKNIKLEGMGGSLFPSKIEKAILNISMLNPTKVLINIHGEFGYASGYFDLTKSFLHLELTPSNLLKRNYSFVFKMMKKSNKKYVYEYKL